MGTQKETGNCVVNVYAFSVIFPPCLIANTYMSVGVHFLCTASGSCGRNF